MSSEMNESQKWKRLQFKEEGKDYERELRPELCGKMSLLQTDCGDHSSVYLLARDEQEEERRKELLYRVLGPVFFGKKEAESWQELRELFRRHYGIEVDQDFYEGDEHYEEYLEAQQAIAEGMAIYSGRISFDETAMAECAETIWDNLEQSDRNRFRRINTLLEE